MKLRLIGVAFERRWRTTHERKGESAVAWCVLCIKIGSSWRLSGQGNSGHFPARVGTLESTLPMSLMSSLCGDTEPKQCTFRWKVKSSPKSLWCLRCRLGVKEPVSTRQKCVDRQQSQFWRTRLRPLASRCHLTQVSSNERCSLQCEVHLCF